MKGIRLKGNLRESNLQDRLKYKPEILEFYLSDVDLEQPAADLILGRIGT